MRKNPTPSVRTFFRRFVTQITLVSLLASSFVAQTAKRPLSPKDFDAWRSIQGAQISRDGKFIAYVMQPQDGDGEVFVRSTTGDTEWRAPRGYRPPTPPPDASDPAATAAFQALGRLLRPTFSADGRHLFFNIEPNKADIFKARKDKKPAADFPKNALGIMDLETGKVTRVEEVKSYQVPEEASGFVAILKEQTREEKRTDTASNSAPRPSPTPAGPRKEYGSTLILRDLSDARDRTFADVLDYSFAKDGKSLVFAVQSRKEETNGAFVVTPQDSTPPVALLKGIGKYTKFTWDEAQTQLAFISDRDDAAAKIPKFKVYHWKRGSESAVEVVSIQTAGFRPEFVVSEKGSLSFSFDGSRLFISSSPEPEPPADTDNPVPVDERVIVDLWHWKDDRIQPMQKVRAIADRDRSYRAVWHINEQKFVQLADTTMEGVIPSSNGLFAIGSDDREYRIRSNYDPGFSDYYLVNTLDGTRKLLLKAARFGLIWSPNSKFVIFFDGKDWNSVSVPETKVMNLTAKIKTTFAREDHDTPNATPPYGIAGWTKDDAGVLIYDRFDIWHIAADGSGARMITDGIGRREKTAFRYVRLDPDERFVSTGQDLLLRAESEENRDSGFYRATLERSPVKLRMEAKDFSNPVKAKDAEVLMFQATRFDLFPDIWVSAPDFASPRRLSDGDSQRAAFNWGQAELIKYKSGDGDQLQGIVIKPDNFDPKRKYPMIVYIYEKLSDRLHSFQNPGPGTSVNFSYYSSNDYVIFMPDIIYKTGYPGRSAMRSVMPGVEAVVKAGFVDENAIGIQGHSWGGYQIAYMITKTDRFKAAAPGALVSNMFSAYNGIRWGTGLPRQFQYERTQSRIGANIWDATDRFMENSPVFHVKNVRTPVLMLHNDNDDAVPWYQGIEFYLSLRRLGKEVYFFNYNGEFHGLRRRQNQEDYSRRMKEFFDTKLKGSPAPEWMVKGIPFLQREKEKLQYRENPASSTESGVLP